MPFYQMYMHKWKQIIVCRAVVLGHSTFQLIPSVVAFASAWRIEDIDKFQAVTTVQIASTKRVKSEVQLLPRPHVLYIKIYDLCPGDPVYILKTMQILISWFL